MKVPSRILPLIEEGLIDEVHGRLMSGKEADVYIVSSNGKIRCAKVYKEAMKRSFKQAVLYQEGRKSRNSRRDRAMERGSKYGRRQQEETWHNAEVDALRKLAKANVRVPEPYSCVDGVLLMELVTDSAGEVAPRLSETSYSAEEALRDHGVMMRYIVRMLCAGIVHGDLSEFNVLVDAKGPVIIDLPQAVNASANNNAEAMLKRDVNRITRFYGQFAPELLSTRYANEIWALFSAGNLHPESRLTGVFADSNRPADVHGVLQEIEAILVEEQLKQARLREAENSS